MTDADLLRRGERIQNLRAAFNRREGIKPADFAPHPRMLGEGDGNLDGRPAQGHHACRCRCCKDDYYRAMHWNPRPGISRERAPSSSG